MSVNSFKELMRHTGHRVVCTFYSGDHTKRHAQNVAIECETCNEVLLDFDKASHECPECNGTGVVGEPCQHCDGTGMEE